MNSYSFEVIVSCKEDVLDPEGRVICETFRRKNFLLSDVRVSKRYVLSLEGELKDCEKQAKKLAEEHLSNPVAEDYKLRRLEL